MADDEYVALLRQGPAVWNDWRAENPELFVDLREATLEGANLRKANLRKADLREATLVWANLRKADLRGAYLWGANLRQADLDGADLRGARLLDAYLSRANLRQADLDGAELWQANLRQADLRQADLRDADLRQATLIDSRLDGADLTGAKFWETQRGGWSIKGVICQRAFWDRHGEEPTEYGDGDFERIFAEKPRIKLRYPGGLSPGDFVMLPMIIERLQAENPDCALHIRSVQDDGSGAMVIITVDDLANRGAEDFGSKLEALQSELATVQHRLRDETLRLVAEANCEVVKNFFQPMLEAAMRGKGDQYHNPIFIGVADMSEIYNTRAEQIAAVGHVHDNTFQQIWNQAGIDPLQLAKELALLRSAMKQETEGTVEQDEAVGAIAAAEKAAARGDGPTALRHLKAAGKWTLGVAEKIGVAVAAKAIQNTIGISA